MPRINTIDDFWKSIDRTAGEDACWPWLASKSNRGYGKWHYNGKNLRSHRFAFWLETNTNPEAVCHKCDNPSCCNPKHLFAGTNGTNNKDRAIKGRSAHPKGELHPASILNSEDVLFIKKSNLSRKDLAKKFNIHQMTVGQIIRGERWQHITIK